MHQNHQTDHQNLLIIGNEIIWFIANWGKELENLDKKKTYFRLSISLGC